MLMHALVTIKMSNTGYGQNTIFINRSRNHGDTGGWRPRRILGRVHIVECESLDTQYGARAYRAYIIDARYGRGRACFT